MAEDVPACPRFYPTHEEFHDFQRYLHQIRHQGAEEAGICIIVPPRGWTSPFRFHDLKFRTRVQDLSLISGEVREKRTFETSLRKFMYMLALPIPAEPLIRVLIPHATVATIVATTADEHDGSGRAEEGNVEVTVDLDLHALNRAVLRARASALATTSATPAEAREGAVSEGIEWDAVVQELCLASKVVELVRRGEMDPVEDAEDVEGDQGEKDGGSQSVGQSAGSAAGGGAGCSGKLPGFDLPVPAQSLGSCLRGLYKAWIEPFNEYRGSGSAGGSAEAESETSARAGWAAKLASARGSAATEARLDEVSEAEAAPEIAVGTRFWRYFPDEKRCLQGTVSTVTRGKGGNSNRVMRAVVVYDHANHVLPTTPIKTKGGSGGAGNANGDGAVSRRGGERGAGSGGERLVTRGFSKVVNGSLGSPSNKGRKGKGKGKGKGEENVVAASESESFHRAQLEMLLANGRTPASAKAATCNPLCERCLKASTSPRGMVQCVDCDGAYHRKCLNASPPRNGEGEEGYDWFCAKCRKGYGSFLDEGDPMNAAGVEGGGVEQGSKDQGGNDQRSGGGAGDRMRGGQVGRMSARMRGGGKSGKGKEKEVYGFEDGGTETLESFRMASGEWDERYFNGSSNGSAPPGGYQGRKGARGKAGWSFRQLESEFWRSVEDGPSAAPVPPKVAAERLSAIKSIMYGSDIPTDLPSVDPYSTFQPPKRVPDADPDAEVPSSAPRAQLPSTPTPTYLVPSSVLTTPPTVGSASSSSSFANANANASAASPSLAAAAATVSKHVDSGPPPAPTWELSKVSTNSGSLLRHLDGDISGVMVPWLYVGSTFSSFCWHSEDHFLYSANYHHWGASKVWYGIAGTDAEKFEALVREWCPLLLGESPDLMLRITTLFSPAKLRAHGIRVVRAVQTPGKFVVTFPRAYHAGFNTGFNCAEAVNFGSADWLPFGRVSIDNYKKFNRAPVFSHAALVLAVARSLLATPPKETMAALVPTILELEELVKKWRAMAAEAEARGMELVEVEDESEFLGAVKGRVSTRAAKDTVIIRDETHRDGALRHKRIKLKSDADEGKGGSADDSGGQTGRMAARGRTASGGGVGGGRMGSSQEGRMSSPLPSSSSSKAESNSESEMEADDMQLTCLNAANILQSSNGTSLLNGPQCIECRQYCFMTAVTCSDCGGGGRGDVACPAHANSLCDCDDECLEYHQRLSGETLDKLVSDLKQRAADLERWHGRLLETIAHGTVLGGGGDGGGSGWEWADDTAEDTSSSSLLTLAHRWRQRPSMDQVRELIADGERIGADVEHLKAARALLDATSARLGASRTTSSHGHGHGHGGGGTKAGRKAKAKARARSDPSLRVWECVNTHGSYFGRGVSFGDDSAAGGAPVPKATRGRAAAGNIAAVGSGGGGTRETAAGARAYSTGSGRKRVKPHYSQLVGTFRETLDQPCAFPATRELANLARVVARATRVRRRLVEAMDMGSPSPVGHEPRPALAVDPLFAPAVDPTAMQREVLQDTMAAALSVLETCGELCEADCQLLAEERASSPDGGNGGPDGKADAMEVEVKAESTHADDAREHGHEHAELHAAFAQARECPVEIPGLEHDPTRPKPAEVSGCVDEVRPPPPPPPLAASHAKRAAGKPERGFVRASSPKPPTAAATSRSGRVRKKKRLDVPWADVPIGSVGDNFW